MRRFFGYTLLLLVLLLCVIAAHGQKKLVFADGKWTSVDDVAAKTALDFPLTVTVMGSESGRSGCFVAIKIDATGSEYDLRELGFHCSLLKTGDSLRARLGKPVWGSGRQSVFLGLDEDGSGKLKKREFLVVRVYN